MGRPYKYTIDELQDLCASEHLTIIGRSKNPTFLIVKCEICGNLSEKHDATVIKAYHSKCSICFESELARDAESLGMRLLGKSNKTNKNACDYRRYEMSCGHTREFTICKVRNNYIEPSCKDCIEEDVRFIVESHNLEFIEKTLPHRVTVRCKSCSAIFSPQVSNLKHGRSAKCPECGNSSFNRPSKLYLFQITVNERVFLKLGYSSNPYFRSTGYKLPAKSECHLLFNVEVASAKLAKKLEQFLFVKYSKYRLPREETTSYMVSGFTECLSIDCKDLLYNELTKIAKCPTIYLQEVKDAT